MKEPIEDAVGSALRRLREASAHKGAAENMETALMMAFTAHHSSKPTDKRRWILASAAVAASLSLAVVSYQSDPVKVQTPDVPHTMYVAPSAQANKFENGDAVAEVEVEPAEELKRKPAVRRRRSSPVLQTASDRAKQPRSPRQQEFVQIPYAPAFSPYESGHIVRVDMPGASARRLGLPVVMDRVQADVLLGNDGLARAVRVVSNSRVD